MAFVLRRRTKLLAGVAITVGALLAVPNLASAQKGCGSQGIPTCPYSANLGFFGPIPGSPLTSWDISWVDSEVQRSDAIGLENYYLADRSNASVDVIPIGPNPPVFKVTGGFSGNTGNNNTAGPNGIITFDNSLADPPTIDLWAGDGPTANSVCPSGTMCSTVKVFQGISATLTHTINTGGTARADELCFDADHSLVVIANDADTPPFISFIPTAGPTAYTVVKKIFMDGTALPGGNGMGATNGIEQCQYSHLNHHIYINIPEVGGPGDDSADGAVLEIDPVAMSIGQIFDVPNTECAGPQGLAIGPASGPGGSQLLLGCNAQTTSGPAPGKPGTGPQNSVILSTFPSGVIDGVIAILANQGGSDEVWFEPHSGNYFLGNGSSIPAQEIGIASSASLSPIQNAFVGFSGTTTRRSHSVAGWWGDVAGVDTSVAFVPVAQLGGGTVGFSSTLCVNAAANATAQGCIAIFGAPSGP